MWQCGNPWHFGRGGLQAVQQPHVVTSRHLATLQPASSPTLARTLSAKFALPTLYTCKPVVSLQLNLWSAISNSLSIENLKKKIILLIVLFSTKMEIWEKPTRAAVPWNSSSSASFWLAHWPFSSLSEGRVGTGQLGSKVFHNYTFFWNSYCTKLILSPGAKRN